MLEFVLHAINVQILVLCIPGGGALLALLRRVNIKTTCSDPVSADPICPFPTVAEVRVRSTNTGVRSRQSYHGPENARKDVLRREAAESMDVTMFEPGYILHCCATQGRRWRTGARAARAAAPAGPDWAQLF